MRKENRGATIDYVRESVEEMRRAQNSGQLTVIQFDPGWNHSAWGPIIAGGRLLIQYHADRYPICGRDVDLTKWWFTVWFRFDPDWDAIRSRQLVGIPSMANEYLGAIIEVPRSATVIELWFETANTDGCRAYDSRFGANYRFEISRHFRELAPSLLGPSA